MTATHGYANLYEATDASEEEDGRRRIAPGKRTRVEARYGLWPVQRMAAPGAGALATVGTNASAQGGDPPPSPAASPLSLLGEIPGLGDALPHRARMEQAFGADFSSVQVHLGATTRLAAVGATAAAQGETVAFASRTPSPALVAHELTHVVQHRRRGGLEAAPAARLAIGPADSPAEREADAVAARVAAGGAAGPICAAPAGGVQCFAPGSHEDATIEGLRDDFTADEIAATYTANWERDFAQGHPAIAAAVIAWNRLKLSAEDHGGRPEPAAAARFRDAVWAVIDIPFHDAVDESMGGSEDLDHCDRPDEDHEAEADERWRGKNAGLAGYLCDARAYIQDEMLAAVNCFRLSKGEAAVAAGRDNWNGVTRPDILRGSDDVLPSWVPGDHPTRLPTPRQWGPDSGPSRDPIRESTRRRAAAAQDRAGVTPAVRAATPTPAGAIVDGAPAAGAVSDEVRWRVVGQHLGRAMHVLEDFWAHSNWVELGDHLLLRMATGPAVRIPPARLHSGRFETPSKVHALGHKLLALSTAFLDDLPLLRAAYGRAADQPGIRQADRLPWYLGVDSRADDAFDPLDDGWSMFTELFGVLRGANAVEDRVQWGRADVGEILCSEAWLEALRAKARELIREGHDHDDDEEHAAIAKDQDEDGPGHGRAVALASAANRLVFAPLRAIMNDRDEATATTGIEAQLGLVHRILQPPSLDHPLWAAFVGRSR